MILFSESVTGFILSDIGETGSSAGNFAGSSTTYTADITPSAPGTVTVSVAANMAIDAVSNNNTAATNLVTVTTPKGVYRTRFYKGTIFLQPNPSRV